MIPIAGILTGGASRRMGRPKALLDVGGMTLIERVAEVVRPLVGEVVLLGSPPFDIPASLSPLEILEDIHPGIGPMGGLEALLHANRGDKSLLMACDMPYLDPAILLRLAAEDGEYDAAVCETPDESDPTGSRLHPCCGAYLRSSLPEVQVAIRSGRFSMVRLCRKMHTRRIRLEAEEVRWVANWNSPSDLGEAQGHEGAR